MKRFKIGYLSGEDPVNKKVWSGTHHSIYKCLLSIGDVEILGPYEPKVRLWLCKIINQFYLKILRKRVSYRHSVFISKGYADHFNRKLRNANLDCIVAPAASCELAFIETEVPIIYISDGTFAGCLNYHKSLTNLTRKSIREGNMVEQNAIDKSAFIIVSSEWAAKSAIEDYHCKPEKLKVLPFGANMDTPPGSAALINEVPVIWKLLFVGVYWDTKGGEYAYNCFKILLEKGYLVELTVLGCVPPDEFKHQKINVIPFIDKNNPEGREKLFGIFKEHQVLLLPTRFDCTPIVINEASAFGIPSIVANTGGVEGHLKKGQNGMLIDYSDKGEGYARQVENFIKNPEKYIELRKKTRQIYEKELNWDSWKLEFLKILEKII